MIINAVRNSQSEKDRILRNVNRDHIQGIPQNETRSYFFDNQNIIALIEDVCDNYDGSPLINSTRQTMTLVKIFNNDIGMAVSKNPKGINAQAPNNTSPAGTYSGVTTLQQVDLSPMIEVFSDKVVLVIGLKNIQQQIVFNANKATLMTFYPQIP